VILLLGLNLAAWAAYMAPLGRLYAMVEHRDRSISVGNAACVAAGHSPFEHTQVRHGNLEPLWSVVAAALALFRPGRVMAAYAWLTPLSIVAVTIGLYRGLRVDGSREDAWERVLLVLAVLGLSSMSTSQGTPVPPLWAANFLLKPNHATGWALLGALVGMRARGASALRLGLVSGLLAWVFLMDWAFLSAGLLVGLFLRARPDRDLRRLAAALALGGLVALPYIAHLARYYGPFEAHGTPAQVWRDPLGVLLAQPHWMTLDLGLLFLLGVAGALVWRRRGRLRDRELLGVLAGAWLVWLGYEVAAAVLGFSPEPDEIHFFVRLNMALAAGAALAAAARFLEARNALRPGQGHVAVLAVCLPLTFIAYWDPPTMDRYYEWCLPPVRPRVLEYGAWVRANTNPDDVFAAGPEACIWIPALSGRRVLLISGSRPRVDYTVRKEVERTLLTSRDPRRIREAAGRYGVTHVAIDEPLREEYGPALEGLGQRDVYETVFLNAAVKILKLKEAPAAE
jgi:hypothetical protein